MKQRCAGWRASALLLEPQRRSKKCGPLPHFHTTQNFPHSRTDPRVTDAPSSFTRLLCGEPRRCVGVAGEGGGGLQRMHVHDVVLAPGFWRRKSLNGHRRALFVHQAPSRRSQEVRGGRWHSRARGGMVADSSPHAASPCLLPACVPSFAHWCHAQAPVPPQAWTLIWQRRFVM